MHGGSLEAAITVALIQKQAEWDGDLFKDAGAIHALMSPLRKIVDPAVRGAWRGAKGLIRGGAGAGRLVAAPLTAGALRGAGRLARMPYNYVMGGKGVGGKLTRGLSVGFAGWTAYDLARVSNQYASRGAHRSINAAAPKLTRQTSSAMDRMPMAPSPRSY